MNENVNNPPPGQTPPPTTTSEPSGHIDPNAYYELQSRAAAMEAALDQLNPHADRIKRLLNDPNYVKMLDDQDAAAEAIRARREPEIPEGMRPLYDKMSKLGEVAEVFLNERKAAAEEPQRALAAKKQQWLYNPRNEAFYQRIVHEHPNLFENRQDAQDMMDYLGRRAEQSDFPPFEQVWKENEWRFVRGERADNPIPTSALHANAGDVGIPGRSTTEQSQLPIKQRMHNRIIELEEARFGIRRGRAS